MSISAQPVPALPVERAAERRTRLRTQAWLSAWFSAYVVLWLVDGVLRKWVVPGLSDQLYFARDALTLLTLVAVLLAGVPREKSRWLMIAVGAILALAAVGCAQLILTRQPAPSIGVGLVTYGAPVAAVAMVLAMDDRARHLRRLQFLILAFLPVEAALTVVQTLSPDDSVWNRTGDNSVALVTSGQVVRATGTFIAPAALTAYVILATALVLNRLISTGRRIGAVDLVLAASCVATVTLGGSRGAVLGSLIVLAGALIWSIGGQGSSLRRLVRVVAAVALAYVFVRLAGRLFPSVTSAFARRFDEAADNESSSTRILDNAFGYWDLIPSMSWLGDGMGSHTLSGIAAGSPLGWYEIELSRWVAELGAVGLALCLVRQVAAVLLVLAALRAARSSGSPLVLLVALVLGPALLYGSVSAPATLAAGAVAAVAVLRFGWPSVKPQAEAPAATSR